MQSPESSSAHKQARFLGVTFSYAPSTDDFPARMLPPASYRQQKKRLSFLFAHPDKMAFFRLHSLESTSMSVPILAPFKLFFKKPFKNANHSLPSARL